MRVLISNDDGIDSYGIQALAAVMSSVADVTVVAPHRERSTAGHSLTLHKPLRIFERGPGQYATSGTPADCIYLALRQIMKDKPDVILSGINRGANLGTDVFYSGTVAAAREAALMKIPSYAFSLVDSNHSFGKVADQKEQFDTAAGLAREIIEKTQRIDLAPYTLLNVNIPSCSRAEIGPVVAVKQGVRMYENEVTSRTDPRGRDYYWIGGDYTGFEKDRDTDGYALSKNQISITPLTVDCTDYQLLARLASIL